MKASEKTRVHKLRDLLSNRLEKISKDVFKRYYPRIRS